MVAAAVATSLLLAGCGASKSPASPTTPSPATSTSNGSSPTSNSSSASPTASSPTESTGLQAIVLRQDELPAGWVGAPYTPDPSDAADQAALLTCVGAKDTTPDRTGNANSEDFSQAEATISSSASKFRSPADITADIAVLKSPKISACYEVLLRKQLLATLPAGAKIGVVSVTVTPGAAGGPSNVAATATAKIGLTVTGKAAVIYANIAFITGPTIEAEIDFVGLAAPVPASLRTKLIAAVAARAAKG